MGTGNQTRSPRGTDSTLNPELPLQPGILFIRTECGQKLDKKAEYIDVGAGQCGAIGDRTEAQDDGRVEATESRLGETKLRSRGSGNAPGSLSPASWAEGIAEAGKPG